MCGGFINNVRKLDPVDTLAHNAVFGNRPKQNDYSGTAIGQGTSADAARGTGEYALPLPWQQKTAGAPAPRPVGNAAVSTAQLGQQMGSPYQ